MTWALREARVGLAGVHEYLRQAAGPLSHMGGHWTDDEGDDAEA